MVSHPGRNMDLRIIHAENGQDQMTSQKNKESLEGSSEKQLMPGREVGAEERRRGEGKDRGRGLAQRQGPHCQLHLPPVCDPKSFHLPALQDTCL